MAVLTGTKTAVLFRYTSSDTDGVSSLLKYDFLPKLKHFYDCCCFHQGRSHQNSFDRCSTLVVALKLFGSIIMVKIKVY